MSFQRALFGLSLSSMLLCGTVFAQKNSSTPQLDDLGPENSVLAQRVGLWDVVETVWASPTAPPVMKHLVAERRMIGSFLEEVLEPAPNSPPANIERIDYLSFNRIEGRWKYVSMDVRAPVGLMPAASVDAGEKGTIRLTFEPFAILVPNSNITGQLLNMQQIISQTGADHDQKDQYFNLANGTGKSWLAHRYEYVRRPLTAR